jgi:hypothetical protein
MRIVQGPTLIECGTDLATARRRLELLSAVVAYAQERGHCVWWG